MDNFQSTLDGECGKIFDFLRFAQSFTGDPEDALPGSDRMSGDDLQPLHQCLKLFRRDLQCLFFCTGSAETAKLQPFVKKKESIPFPYKPFDAVASSATEEKKDVLFIRIQLEVEFNNRCQTINPVA